MRGPRFALPLFGAAALAAAPLTACITGDESSDDGWGGADSDVAIRKGVDYSFARPSLSAIHADGYTFVVRYLSHTAAKDLTKGEADAIIGAGMDVVLNWEASATNALGGYSQGVADAEDAKAEAAADGAPADAPIYFSMDFDATPGQQATLNAYFDGVASVIGRDRTGAYGGYYPIARLFDAGKIKWGWQTYAWSGGQWDSRAQLRQIENGILGDSCDEDEAVATDFGQWGHTPPPETGPAPAKPAKPTACGAIAPDHGLARGEALASCDGRFELAMQTDGNLVIYSEGVATWSTHTDGLGGDVVVMQGDGNFVLYDEHSQPLFSTHTYGHDGAALTLDNTGNLYVHDGAALWRSDSGGALPKPTEACGRVDNAHGLAVGEIVHSCNGTYAFAMQGDGNLVLYHGRTALWASNTYASGGRWLDMQSDGNLVVYDRDGAAVWDSHTAGDGASTYLAVQDDGNVVLYRGATPVWDTHTNGR